jgi:hypothetical protein
MALSFIGRTDLHPGLRNNNPGNIRPGDAWQGMTGTADGFVVFQDIDWGLRALATDITNKIRDGYNTITALISRYAPPSENDTQSYINAVANETGLDPNQPIDLDSEVLHDLMRAIIDHENGDQATLIPDQDIDTGISMMNNTLQQWIDAGEIALKNPTTPPGILGWGIVIAVLFFGSRR